MNSQKKKSLKGFIAAIICSLLFFPFYTYCATTFKEAFNDEKSNDFQSAFKKYTLLANHGNDTAQFALGTMYGEGQGLPQDYAAAILWFKKAADQGNAAAQHALGFIYQEGQGVPQNYAAAIHWYKKAADQGLAEAQYNLGTIYGNGQGLPLDYVQAFFWFNVAAKLGFAPAQKALPIAEKKMTISEIKKAQALAQEWLEKQKKPEPQ